MKKILFICALFLGGVSVMDAQIHVPAASPGSTVKQTVGLVDVTVEYSRPGIKGRTIFGDLVPYDKVWRLGANSATKITFSGDVTVEGAEVKGGAYALLAKPSRSSWELMLYPYESGNWSSYLEKDAAATVSVESVQMSETVDNFLIAFDGLKNDGAVLLIMWEKTVVPVSIEVNTSDAVEANIEKVMSGPSAGDYFAAASYYASEGKNLKQALTWMDKSIEMGNERFWVLRAKSLIQAKLGDKSGAIATAKKSLEMAKEAGNDDYIKMNTESIKEWSM